MGSKNKNEAIGSNRRVNNKYMNNVNNNMSNNNMNSNNMRRNIMMSQMNNPPVVSFTNQQHKMILHLLNQLISNYNKQQMDIVYLNNRVQQLECALAKQTAKVEAIEMKSNQNNNQQNNVRTNYHNGNMSNNNNNNRVNNI